MSKSIQLLIPELHTTTAMTSYFDLADAFDYYNLYNCSKYINTYHGRYHVFTGLSALMYFGKHKFTYAQLRDLMIAFIFHDFNYHGCDPDDQNYDDINIKNALDGLSHYLQQQSEKFPNTDAQLKYHDLSKLIHATRYPNLRTLDSLPILEQFIIDIDHSMCLFTNYNDIVFDLVYKEFKWTDTKKIITRGLKYLENRMYYTSEIQSFWNRCRSKVIENFINYFNGDAVKTRLIVQYKLTDSSQYLSNLN